MRDCCCSYDYLMVEVICAVAQCIVIGPVCGFVCVCGWLCYHNNWKLHASVLTKLGLWVKVVTIFSLLNFGHPVPPGRGSEAGRNFWLRQHAVFVSPPSAFSFVCAQDELNSWR